MDMMAQRHRIIAAQCQTAPLVFQNGAILTNGKWIIDGSKHESWLLRISPGDKIDAKSGTQHSAFAFLTDNEDIANGAVAHFATGTQLIVVNSDTTVQYTAPAGTKYLQVRKKVSGTETGIKPAYILINGIPVQGL